MFNALMLPRINHIDYPYGSGELEPESAYCAMIDENIVPQVTCQGGALSLV